MRAGFTLIELIVVIAVMAVLAGTMVPLFSATQDAERIATVEEELEALGEALRDYYFDKGQFPAALTEVGFYGAYIVPGVQDDRIEDEWGARQPYKVARATSPDTITVYSVGENGQDEGPTKEAWTTTVSGAEPGNRRSRERMRIIAAVLAGWLAGGGTLTGTWPTDRAAMGLGPEYEQDGFGSAFTLDAATYVLRSAGADRVRNTADDLVL